MTLEELQEARRRLGEEQLEGRREDCSRRSAGHDWTPTEATVPELYCSECYHMPDFDR
jgi:hypothetical protein